MALPESQLLQITLSCSANIHRQGKQYCLVSGSGDSVSNYRDYEGPLFPMLNYLTFAEKQQNTDDVVTIGPQGTWSSLALSRVYPTPPIGVLCFQMGSGLIEVIFT